jgi:hypothetical protein
VRCFFLRFFDRVINVEFADRFTKPQSDEDELEDGAEPEPKQFGQNDNLPDDDYNWYCMINTLAGNQIWMFETILQLPFKRCLGHLRWIDRENEKLQNIYNSKNKINENI